MSSLRSFIYLHFVNVWLYRNCLDAVLDAYEIQYRNYVYGLPLFHIFQSHNDSQTTRTNFCLASRDMKINTRRKWKSYRFHEHEKSMPSGFCGFTLSLALRLLSLVAFDPRPGCALSNFITHNKVHTNLLFLTFPFFPFAETSSEMGSNIARDVSLLPLFHYFTVTKTCSTIFAS